MKIKYYSNVILLGLSVCSQAAPIESLKEKEQLLICQKERDTGRFQEAVDCYLPLAEKENNIIAQTFLAHIYEHQKELNKQDQAIYWYEKAAHQGDKYAQNNLGRIYLQGEITPIDNKKAIYWLEKAEAQGVITSQYNLGIVYEANLHDYQKAAYWYEKAAKRGDAGAQNALGSLYSNGKGIPKNEHKALYWVNLSAEKGHVPAYTSLGIIYEYGYGVKADIEKAFDYYQKAAEAGEPVAQTNLANIYYRSGNLERAKYWLEKAAQQNNELATKHLERINAGKPHQFIELENKN